MSLETLEFIIFPDGRVKERVTGIVGVSCESVTAAIESQLGRIISQEKTPDFYQQPLTQSGTCTQQTQPSQW